VILGGFEALKLLLGGWATAAFAFLKSLPWWVWAILAALILLLVVYLHGEKAGETKGAEKTEKRDVKAHAKTIAESTADTKKAQTTTDAIGSRMARVDVATTDLVRAKLKDMNDAIAVPAAPAGDPPARVDTRSLSASVDALVERANGQADAADAQP
jgi:type III secretory pathway component EscV